MKDIKFPIYLKAKDGQSYLAIQQSGKFMQVTKNIEKESVPEDKEEDNFQKIRSLESPSEFVFIRISCNSTTVPYSITFGNHFPSEDHMTEDFLIQVMKVNQVISQQDFWEVFYQWNTEFSAFQDMWMQSESE